MKMMNKKSTLLLIMAAVLLTASVGVTVAYLVAVTPPVVNTFEPAKVDTEVVESFDGSKKSSIAIKNDAEKGSNIPVYVRVAVSGYWCNESGEIKEPWANNISLNTNANTDSTDKIADGAWFKGSDDYYYYNKPIDPGYMTTNLLDSSLEYAKEDDGSYLVVNVIHQSIQSKPTSVVHDEWGVTVASDGTISK